MKIMKCVNHNKKLVDKINKIYADESQRKHFKNAVKDLVKWNKKDYLELIDPTDVKLKKVVKNTSAFLEQVCTNKDLEYILDVCLLKCSTIYCIEVHWTEQWNGEFEPSNGTSIVKCFKNKKTAERYLEREFEITIIQLEEEITDNGLEFDEKYLHIDRPNKFVSYHDKNVHMTYTGGLVKKPFYQ